MRKINKKFLRRLINPAWLYKLKESIKPLNDRYGMSRGLPVDRYYIKKIIWENKNIICGRCLEIKDNRYGKKLQNIEKLDILDIDKNNKEANLHGDLKNLHNIPDNLYDSIILTQVLQYIDEPSSALRECFRILKIGGHLFLTVPAMSRHDPKAEEFWRFTSEGINKLLSPIFSDDNVKVVAYGNVLSGLAFWIGQAAEELSKEKIDFNDPNFPVLIAALATKK